MTESDTYATTRFSDRVQNYTRYRPSYPRSAIQWIVDQYSLDSDSRVIDVGSGTGIFTQALMAMGLRVIAVEPNLEMRLESDRRHKNNPLYSSQDGTAESTQLETNCVDVVTAAQAGHWFDIEKSKREFQRILRPKGVLAMVWNRREHTSDFQSAYEAVLSSLPEYAKVHHRNLDDAKITGFFADNMQRKAFANSQEFDLAGFRGRVFSSSYTPNSEDHEYETFSRRINELFSEHASDGRLSFAYTTEVYSGRME